MYSPSAGYQERGVSYERGTPCTAGSYEVAPTVGLYGPLTLRSWAGAAAVGAQGPLTLQGLLEIKDMHRP